MPDPEKNGAASTSKEAESEKEGKRITRSSAGGKAPRRDGSVQKKVKRSRKSSVPKKTGVSAPARVEDREALRKRSRSFLDQEAGEESIDEGSSRASKGKAPRKETQGDPQGAPGECSSEEEGDMSESDR